MFAMVAFFLFLSYNSIQVSLKYILDALEQEDPSFYIDAYTGKLVLFTFNVIWTPFASIVVNKIGPRPSLVLVICCHLYYGIQFLFIMNWTYLIGCAVIGTSNAFFSVAGGRYLAQNSTELTIARNSAISLMLQAMQGIIRYFYFYFRFKHENISAEDRREFYTVFVFSYFISLIFAFSLLKAVNNEPVKETMKESFETLFALLRRRDMWLMIPTLVYLGLNASWGTLRLNGIVFTKMMIYAPSPMRIIAELGAIQVLCTLINGLVLSLCDQKIMVMTNGYHYPVVIFGFAFNLFQMIIDFLNLPDESPHGYTDDKGLVEPSYIFAVISSFFGGLSSMCIQTRKAAMLLILFKDRIAHAYAVSHFFAIVGAIIPLVLIHVTGFYWITFVAIVSAIVCVSCFCVCETDLRDKENESSEEEKEVAEDVELPVD